MNRLNLLVIGGLLTLSANAALLNGDSAGPILTNHSAISTGVFAAAPLMPAVALQDCVHSQGFWKNNADAWPVDSLTLGDVEYTQEELLDILNQPPRGNGLVILAKQLIAAKLNVEDEANTPESILDAIDEADALIGDMIVPPVGDDWLHPSMTGALSSELAAFNDGELHDENCELIEPEP